MREVAESRNAELITLEWRMRRLENQVEVLAKAVEVLARGLETGPMVEPEDSRPGEAARQARELLLLVSRGRPSD